MGEGGDEVSVVRFIADQRTKYRVPHTITCALLGSMWNRPFSSLMGTPWVRTTPLAEGNASPPR